MLTQVLWPLLLPIAAASGWWAARQKPDHSVERLSRISREYYLGLNYLLNEQPDKAVDVFIKLLEIDSETVEMHLTLGNLFRRRGEVDRAIRIHQNLIARPQLSRQERTEALLALGRDYMSAGVLDRAERVFREVVDIGGEHNAAALNYLLDIYVQEQAWSLAIVTVESIEKVTQDPQNRVIAHLYCELAQLSFQNQNSAKAKRYLELASQQDPQLVRVSLMQAQMASDAGDCDNAIQFYKKVKSQDPEFISEAIVPMVACYKQLGQEDAVLSYLQQTLNEYPRIAIVSIIASVLRKNEGVEVAADFFADQLRRNPSLRGLNTLIAWHIENAEGKLKSKLQVLQDLTTKLLDNKPIYRCDNCGLGMKTLYWHCPSCRRWSSVHPIHGIEGD